MRILEHELRALDANPAYIKEQTFTNNVNTILSKNNKSLSDIVKTLIQTPLGTGHVACSKPCPGHDAQEVELEHINATDSNSRVSKQWKLQYPNGNIKDVDCRDSK